LPLHRPAPRDRVCRCPLPAALSNPVLFCLHRAPPSPAAVPPHACCPMPMPPAASCPSPPPGCCRCRWLAKAARQPAGARGENAATEWIRRCNTADSADRAAGVPDRLSYSMGMLMERLSTSSLGSTNTRNPFSIWAMACLESTSQGSSRRRWNLP
jgi:hypothetical protein